MTRKPLIVLGVILSISLALRLGVVFAIPSAPHSDSWSYMQRASSLHDTATYEAISGRPDASYPPGYPLFLSFLYSIPADRLLISKFANVILGLGSIFLLAALIHRLLGPWPAVVGALLLAVYPAHVMLSNLILSENLFIPLLLCWALHEVQTNHRPVSSVWSGLIAGATVLVRAIGVVLVVPWLVRRFFHRQSFRGFLVAGFLFHLSLSFVITPWIIRNARVLGAPVVLTTTSGVNLFIGNNEGATGSWYPWLEDIQRQVPNFSDRTVVDQNRVALRAALAWMRSNPLETIKLYGLKLISIFQHDQFAVDAAITARDVSPPWPSSSALPDDHPALDFASQLRFITDIYYWIMSALSVGGIILVLRSRKYFPIRQQFSAWILLGASAAILPLSSAVFLGSVRFKWPSTILLIPFAVFALLQMHMVLRKSAGD